MNRREAISLGGATLAGALFARSTHAQSAAPASAPAAAAAPGKLRLDCYSRTLNWLRTPAEVAEACHEVGYTSVDLTVRSGSGGHVDPANVKTELPAFTKGLREHGIDVSMIAPTITNADDKYAEDTLAAAQSVGIRYYWWGTHRYDETKPYWPQLDALKPKVEALAKLNEKYGIKAMAHPRDGAGSVSAAFFDLLYVLKNFDPRWVSFQYDTHHLLQAYDGGWVQQLRLGAPYIGGFVWKDVMIEPVGSPNPDDDWRKAHPRTPQVALVAVADLAAVAVVRPLEPAVRVLGMAQRQLEVPVERAVVAAGVAAEVRAQAEQPLPGLREQADRAALLDLVVVAAAVAALLQQHRRRRACGRCLWVPA